MQSLIFLPPLRAGRAQGVHRWRTEATRPERGARRAGRCGSRDVKGSLAASPAQPTASADGTPLFPRAAPAHLGSLDHEGPLVIQAPLVYLDPWGYQDHLESL